MQDLTPQVPNTIFWDTSLYFHTSVSSHTLPGYTELSHHKPTTTCDPSELQNDFGNCVLIY